MAYRNGTYIAFHADGNNRPGKTDIDYYNLLKAWSAHPDDDFTMINSHDKVASVRDSSLRATLRASLHQRLKNSRNMLLIIGETTKNDLDWVPFEIEQAVDQYDIPLIAAYTMVDTPVRDPVAYSRFWPAALSTRINNSTASVIHIPFKKPAIQQAVKQFDYASKPRGGGIGTYDDAAYQSFGIAG